MKSFSELIKEGLFSKKAKLDDKTASILRLVTDIVGSWSIKGKYLVGDGTDMSEVVIKDMRRLSKQFPDIDWEIEKTSESKVYDNWYYTIKTKLTDTTIEYINKKGYR